MKSILLGEPPEAPTHTAAVIRATEVPPAPPPQVPRPYCALLMRGLQTRWYSSADDAKRASDHLTVRGVAHKMYRYEPSLERYTEYSPYL